MEKIPIQTESGLLDHITEKWQIQVMYESRDSNKYEQQEYHCHCLLPSLLILLV